MVPKLSQTALSADYLSKPANNITVHKIDFSKISLPEYEGLYAVILDNVLTAEECNEMLKAAEASTDQGWKRATINLGGGREALMIDSRNCGRIVWDQSEVATKVWKRIEHLPEVQEIVRLRDVPRIFGRTRQKRGEVWKFSRPNDRMRFLKYVGGEYFRPHSDGCYKTRDRKERSYFTLQLYLNSAGPPSEEEMEGMDTKERLEFAKMGLTGGATIFHSKSMIRSLDFNVMPKTGRVLLFQHRDLLHSGDDVLQGTKYTMRTDLMYALESTKSESKSRRPKLED